MIPLLQNRPELAKLRDRFVLESKDIRFVGGCVRDEEPKDIDLCTDATPDEMIAIFEKYGYRYYKTGDDHGTLTVGCGGEHFEITTLRTETDHTGRHATVHFTTDWTADQARRDLTINSMAMTFDGELIDPFGGKIDLENKIVRFVGDPNERMQEDYLRILRLFRFHGRIAAGTLIDPETAEAIKRNAHGLQGISRERVWMEMSKIISGPDGDEMIRAIYALGVADWIGLPHGNTRVLTVCRSRTRNPVTLMVALLVSETGAWVDMATAWKWSAKERDLAKFLVKHANYMYKPYDDFIADTKAMLVRDKHPWEWVKELLLFYGETAAMEQLERWPIPVFPVGGEDLKAIGFLQGREMGAVLKKLMDHWIASDYQDDRADLLAKI